MHRVVASCRGIDGAAQLMPTLRQNLFGVVTRGLVCVRLHYGALAAEALGAGLERGSHVKQRQ